MSASPVSRVLERFLCHGTIEDVEDLTGQARRIRIAGESVRNLSWVPGQHVRLQVGDLLHDFRDALRTYSIWDFDADLGRLDLCILDHPDAGPGARWSRDSRVGQRVSFTRPEGRLVARSDAPHHLFVGDETAAVAFGAILRALPATAAVRAVLEVGDPDGRLPVPRAGELTWVYRDPHSTSPLVDAVHRLDLPDEPGVAYIAGEVRACQAVRHHLVRHRGWPRRSIIVKPFWTPGKRGLD